MFVTAKIRALLPRVVERREIIRDVAKRWEESYPDDSRTLARGAVAGDIRRGLEALDLETATVADVKAIIGNDSWTELKCDICEQDRDRVVSIPREYESSIAVCGDCAEGVVETLAATPLTYPAST